MSGVLLNNYFSVSAKIKQANKVRDFDFQKAYIVEIVYLHLDTVSNTVLYTRLYNFNLAGARRQIIFSILVAPIILSVMMCRCVSRVFTTVTHKL